MRLRSRRRRLPDFFWGRDMQAIFRSKRFWIAVSGVIAVAIGDRLPIDEDQIQQVVMLLAAWIVGDSLRQTSPPTSNVYGGRR